MRREVPIGLAVLIIVIVIVIAAVVIWQRTQPKVEPTIPGEPGVGYKVPEKGVPPIPGKIQPPEKTQPTPL